MKVLITGGSRGLGRALAEAAVADGHAVVVVDRAGSAEDGIDVINADLADTGGLEELAARLAAAGPYGVVIHNAGVNYAGAFDTVSAAAHLEILAVNLVAPMVLTARLLAGAGVTDGAMLVFVGTLGTAVGYPGAASYAASKAGLMNFARNIQGRHGGRHVRCLCVYPGPLKTAQAARNAPRGTPDNRRLAPDAAAREIWLAVANGNSRFCGWRVRRRVPWPSPRSPRRAGLSWRGGARFPSPTNLTSAHTSPSADCR